jgi:hypothetical protein
MGGANFAKKAAKMGDVKATWAQVY